MLHFDTKQHSFSIKQLLVVDLWQGLKFVKKKKNLLAIPLSFFYHSMFMSSTDISGNTKLSPGKKKKSKLHVHSPAPEKKHHRDPLGKSETTCQIREMADNERTGEPQARYETENRQHCQKVTAKKKKKRNNQQKISQSRYLTAKFCPTVAWWRRLMRMLLSTNTIILTSMQLFN